jgi:hypothetical protein
MGGNITLEEKLLLKSSGDLSKYSFTPMSPEQDERKRPPQSASSRRSEQKIKVYDTKPRAFVEYLVDLRLNKEDFSLELEKYLAKQEERFQTVISNVKGLLEKEKVNNRKLRHAQAKQGILSFYNCGIGTTSTKGEMLTYFSGVIHDSSPSQTSVNQNKFSNRILKARGKTAGSSRPKSYKHSLKKPKLAFMLPGHMS